MLLGKMVAPPTNYKIIGQAVMCCLTASFKYLKDDLVFSAEVCFEMEN